MAGVSYFGYPKITFNSISCHFRSIHFFLFFFSKWQISKFPVIHNFFFPQNGCRPIWMPENHFRAHIYITISDQYAIFFYKMAAVSYIGCPKITFNSIYCKFRSIHFFSFFFKMATGSHVLRPIITKICRALPPW